MSKPKILVVDNDRELCESFKTLLTADEFHVDYVLSIPDAIRQMKSKHYDLVYIDILLPGIIGIDSFAILIKISPRTQLVYIADAIDQRLSERELAFIRSGGLIYTPHLPFLTDEIREATRAILDRKIAG